MAEAKDCPRCRLVNPPSAQRCDCGYDFVSRTQERSFMSSGSGRPDGGSRVLGYGCLLLAPLFLLAGIMSAVKVGGAAAAGDAFALGQVCGAFIPGLAALIFAAYLLRRGR
jgi:hypothetical protein